MSHASRFAASQYLLYGRIVPGSIATPEGFDGTRPYSFGAGLPAGVFVFPLVGKCKSMRVRLVLLASAMAAARFERELYTTESCLVALSNARGDGLSRRESQSWPIRVLHRGAIELSGVCGSGSFMQSESH
jgi:hypothetical protein